MTISKTSLRKTPLNLTTHGRNTSKPLTVNLRKRHPLPFANGSAIPKIRPADEVPDSELAGELEALIKLLHANGIVIEFIHDIEDREAFDFITEELLDETMDDIHSPGMYSHFIYEEFHPNDEDDIELWTGEFLDTFFKEGTEASFIPIGDKELYDADENPISEGRI